MAHDVEHAKSELSTLIAGNMRRSRTAAGITQQQIADAVGIDKSSWTRVESGERKVSFVEAVLAARRMSVPIEQLTLNPEASDEAAA